MTTKLLYLCISGALGTVSRYALAGAVYRILGTGFPHGTFVVNMAGCFFIGLLAVLSEKKFVLGPEARLFLMIGFCGAFTTFSTFILESAQLIRAGEAGKAFLNVGASVALGFILLWLGMVAGELL